MRNSKVIRFLVLALLVSVIAWASPVLAQQVFIYPERGQSPEQQSRDQAECQGWAMQQSGVNPGAPAGAPLPPPPSGAPQGQVLRGAGRGAALGAVGGAIGGDAGKGAAIGAATGGMVGAMRRRDDMRSQQQAYEGAVAQQQAAQSQGAATFNRALSACLAGRGYTVR